jgi:putative transposase
MVYPEKWTTVWGKVRGGKGENTVSLKRNRKHSSKEKAKVALDAIRERETIPQLASKYQVHSSQVSKWKKVVIDGLPELFETAQGSKHDGQSELIDQLYQQIGQLQVELAWMKKKGGGYWC